MRVCVYFMDESLKSLESYTLEFLNGMRKITDKIVIVNNDIANIEIIDSLQDYSVVVTYNSLKQMFFNDNNTILKDYTEVIFCDNTYMGPVYPFDSIFDEMKQRGAKVWNIVSNKKSIIDGLFTIEKKLITDHMIDEVFISQKVSLENYLENKNITIDHYIDISNYNDKSLEPMLMYPLDLIQNQKCPVFDFEVFVKDYFSVLETGTGLAARELYDYLVEHTKFNIDVLWDKLLKDYNQADIAKNLNLNYIVCKDKKNTNHEYKDKKIVLVMHLYYSDLFENSISFASSVPEQTDIFITTDCFEKKKLLEQYLKYLEPRRCEIRVIPNRGRDISSLLVGVKDVITEYEYACFVHDKKSSQTEFGSTGEGFYSRIFYNTLCNSNYVANIITLFENNRRLGMLSPAPPNHSDYFTTLGQEWGVNYENTKQLAVELGLNVSIDSTKDPIAPFGTCFWFRVDAMEPLYNKNWEYEDFPQEPNGTDGTLLHAIERIYPYVVQAQGYYPAFILEKGYAELDLTNLQFYVRNYNYILLNFGEIGGRITDMCRGLQKHLNGGDTPIAQRLHEYIQAHDRVNEEWQKTALVLQGTEKELKRFQEEYNQMKMAHDRVNEEWRKTALVLQGTEKELKRSQEEYNQMKMAHDRVNEEWRKTAELLKCVQEAHDSIEAKYRKTFRARIESFVNYIVIKYRNMKRTS